jgi:hypothetical protein
MNLVPRCHQSLLLLPRLAVGTPVGECFRKDRGDARFVACLSTYPMKLVRRVEQWNKLRRLTRTEKLHRLKRMEMGRRLLKRMEKLRRLKRMVTRRWVVLDRRASCFPRSVLR